MPEVSIIIPTHKPHAYLHSAIESALIQTIKDIEIIVVNDGAGINLTNELRNKFPTIKIIDLLKNRGVSAARNIAAASACGKYIAFLDSDDIAENTRIEMQLIYAKENPAISGNHCGSLVFDEHGVRSRHVEKPEILKPEDILLHSHVPPSCLLMKKSTFIQYGGFAEDMRVSEDADLIVRMVKNGEKIGFLPMPLLRFRRMNHGNISTNGMAIFKGKMQLLIRNLDFFISTGGILHPFRFAAYWMKTAGYRAPNIIGKLLILGGTVLSKLTASKF